MADILWPQSRPRPHDLQLSHRSYSSRLPQRLHQFNDDKKFTFLCVHCQRIRISFAPYHPPDLVPWNIYRRTSPCIPNSLNQHALSGIWGAGRVNLWRIEEWCPQVHWLSLLLVRANVYLTSYTSRMSSFPVPDGSSLLPTTSFKFEWYSAWVSIFKLQPFKWSGQASQLKSNCFVA